MGIISSNYAIDAHSQADGTKYVVETHTDNLGRVYTFGPYRVSDESLVSELLTARIQKLDYALAEAEVDRVLSINSTLILAHQTKGEFAARFWTRLQDAYSSNKEYFCYLIWWLYNRVSAGDVTSNEIRLSYNAYFNKTLNTTQWSNLVNTRLIPARDRYQAILDEAPL